MERSNDNGYLEFLFVCLIVLVTIFLLGVAGNTGQQHSKPILRENAAPGDCAACHAEQKVLPHGHEDTQGMMMGKCAACHTRTEQNLWSKISLAHIHGLLGIGCGGCHKDSTKFGQLSTADCLACHQSFVSVAARTQTRRPDPHNSPHYGNSVDCDLCHRIHTFSENFCAQCHDWKLTVP